MKDRPLWAFSSWHGVERVLLYAFAVPCVCGYLWGLRKILCVL
jgi:hypothetical protein